ncbi:MAG: oligosaccharide flippase family protein [Nanoarchaeota archaeon]|nr:oligosaccharide flippase family protein [Nanoarchaeota archaeon]
MSNHVGKIIRGTGFIFAATFIAALFSYATRVVVARKLGPEQYGLFASVYTFILFFLFFRDLGLGTALVNYVTKARIEENYNKIKTAIVSVFGMQLLSSSLIGILIIIFSRYLSVHYFKVPESRIILLILVIYTMTSILYTIPKALLNTFQKTILFSSMEPAKNLFILLSTLLLFHYDFGIIGAAIPYAILSVIFFFIYQPFVQKKIKFFKHKVVNLKETTKELLSFGLPLMAADIGGKVIGYTDTLMLTYFVSLTDVGIYNVVLPSALFFIQISRAISAIVFPISTELHYKKDTAKLAKGVSLLHSYCFALIIPIIFTLFAFTGFFLDLFFGADYVAGALAFQILLVGSMFFILASVNNIIISSMGEPKQVTKIILLSAILNVGLNFFLIPQFGINGAAVATALAYALSLVLSTRKLLQNLDVPLPFLQWGKLFLIASVFVMMIFYVMRVMHYNLYVEMVLSTLIATLMYILLLYLFNIIDFQDLKKNLLKVFKK